MKALCPNCGHKFERKRHDKGAGYALEWDELPQRCTKLLRWWLHSPYINQRLTKDEIARNYGHATIGGIVARIPELYALNLLNRHKREKPQYPTVTYSLNLPFVMRVISAGMKLDVIREDLQNLRRKEVDMEEIYVPTTNRDTYD